MNVANVLVPIVMGSLIGAWSTQTAPEIGELVGDWSGTSICQVKPSACHDEKVVYHLSGPHENKIKIQADKIVDGKPVNMGASEWTYDKPTRTLKWQIPQGTWQLVVNGNAMEGTLTAPDSIVFRKVHLSRSK